MRLLYAVMEGGHEIGMDLLGKMLAEYYRYVDFNGVVGEWFKGVSQGMVFFAGQLEPDEIIKLEDAGGDDDDYPFIGVAKRTNSGLLFHHDRGYDQSPEIREVLSDLGVKPYRPNQALAEGIL